MRLFEDGELIEMKAEEVMILTYAVENLYFAEITPDRRWSPRLTFLDRTVLSYRHHK